MALSAPLHLKVLYVAKVLATWIGLLPLLACGVYWIRHVTPPANAVLLSLGFAVSFLADLTGKTLAAEGVNTWFLSFIWPPVQLAWWWAVIAQRDSVRWTGSLAILLAGLLSLLQGPLMALELVVRCLGALAVILLAWKSVGIERYRPAILVTGVAMIVFALPLRFTPVDHWLWLVMWGGFQAMRLVALLLMAWAILSPKPLEVVDGRGALAQARGEGRSVDRLVRRAGRSPLAQA